MTPDQLLTFAEVAHHGSISRAAEALHLSQPAVSGQLRLLQDSFGQPLYRRQGRGIELTSAGQQVASLARQLAQTYERLQQLRDAMADWQTGSLILGASTTPASYLLPHLIARFRERYPNLDLQLLTGNTSDICQQLARFDLAFIEGSVPTDLPSHTEVRPWHSDEILVIVPPDHPLLAVARAPEQAGFGGLSMSALADWPLVLREPGSGVRQQVLQALQDAGIPARIAFELAGVEGVKEGVRAGLGIGFVSAMAMQRPDPTLRGLRIIEPAPLERHLTLLIPHADSVGAPTLAFADACFQATP